MAAKGIITAIFAVLVLLMATVSWAMGGGGGGAGAGADGFLTPDPPANVTATAGNGEATVSFNPPKIRWGEPHNQLYCDISPREDQGLGQAKPHNRERADQRENLYFYSNSQQFRRDRVPIGIMQQCDPKG